VHVVSDMDHNSFLHSHFYSIGERLGCCLFDLFVYFGFCRLSAFVGAECECSCAYRVHGRVEY